MKELLERWASLEPERCTTEGVGDYQIVYDNRGHVLYLDDPEFFVPGDVQLAAQEAIEARYDIWLVQNATWAEAGGYYAEIPAYRARVVYADPSNLPSYPTPAEALLAVYLEALQAEKLEAEQEAGL